MPAEPLLPSGLVAFVKRDCPTCVLVEPVLAELAKHTELTVYTQDDPAFPGGVEPVDDRTLDVSWHHGIETVPTLLSVRDGEETERVIGWHREDWRRVSGVGDLGSDLPERRPGCGSLSVDPDRAGELAVRFGASRLAARRVELAALEDEMEAAFDRGWSDGLPVVPPTELRVLAMLDGTTRAPSEVVAVVPPDLVECTVEKVAINAVMAGCRPEYLPVVIAAVEAACTDEFNIHGLLATTMSTGPILVVNGPIRRAIGMNSGANVLGQGNRANLTIGRALQLVIRNVGGGRPGEVDRATFGNPGKLSFCFAEDEEGSPWTPLSTDLGAEAGVDTVTLFPGEGPRNVIDQKSREPESLARTYAVNLRSVHHPKMVMGFDCMLVVGPEHARVFSRAGWDKARLIEELHSLLQIPGSELIQGAGGIAEGLPPALEGATLPKFRQGGILPVYCGGGAGLFSMIIAGWVNGATGSQPVLREIRP
ncbi:MAG: thioredoxin family protein [Deltaproteobacteria bacterium]|nr:thioredoxin family protein [Deltaproteobacteria bacterium]